MGFGCGQPPKGYGLLVIADLWVLVHKSLSTELVEWFCYGIRGVMGYLRYGLREVQLYSIRFGLLHATAEINRGVKL